MTLTARILALLVARGPMSTGALAMLLNTGPMAVTKCCALARARGLVAGDGRAVSITAKGSAEVALAGADGRAS